MKKLFFTIICLTSFSLSLSAKQINPNSAEKVAATFLNGNSSLRSGFSPSLNLVHTEKENSSTRNGGESEAYYYVYNVGDNNGFIIVSADDVNVPIIAYSDKGNYDPNNIPENFKWWMGCVKMATKGAIEEKAIASETVRRDWDNYMSGTVESVTRAATSVAPLIKTKWGQGTPYNSEIPYRLSNGNPPAAGCVATAMAQIMKYFNHPKSGKGTTMALSGYTFPLPGINLSLYSYDWSSMLNNYNATATTAQKKAVGLLMYHCGASVTMNYGPSSYATTGAAFRALKKHFNYSSAIALKYKSEMSDLGWKSLLKEELTAGRPVFYRGDDTTTGEGHAFVCDGYDTSGRFHFNWGWDGAYDAYCDLNALKAGRYDFSKYNAIICGIKPITTAACTAPTDLTVSNITAYSATVRWNTVSGASSYLLEHNFHGGHESSWEEVLVSNNYYTITGLSSNYKYNWRVKTICTNGGESSSVSGTAFSTPAWCIANYEPNETLATARLINTNTTYYAGIGNSTDKDYYKFTLSSPSSLVITLQNLPKDYELILFNSAGTEIASSKDGGTNNEIITTKMALPGTYYVLVEGYSSLYDLSKCYELRVAATTTTLPQSPCVIKYEPNETLTTAYNIKPNTIYEAYIGSITDKDYYKFTLPQTDHITITAKNLHGDMRLFDSSGKLFQESIATTDTDRQINRWNIPAGTYYIYITEQGGNTNPSNTPHTCYQLNLFSWYTTYPNRNATPTDITLKKNDADVHIYPNPTEDMLNIKSETTINKVTLSDFSGKIVFTDKNAENEKAISVGHLPKGLYIVNVETENGIVTEKINIK